MNLNAYQDKAETTAIFGEKICELLDAAGVDDESDGYGLLLGVMSNDYWILGFGDEMVEIITLVDEGSLTPEKLKKEMGDAMWYIALGARRHGIRLMDAFKVGVAPPMEMSGARLLTRMIKQSGALFGMGKRLIREKKGVTSEDDRKAFAIILGSLTRTIMALADFYMLDFDEILSANLEKLASRLARKVITGAGDDR